MACKAAAPLLLLLAGCAAPAATPTQVDALAAEVRAAAAKAAEDRARLEKSLAGLRSEVESLRREISSLQAVIAALRGEVEAWGGRPIASPLATSEETRQPVKGVVLAADPKTGVYLLGFDDRADVRAGDELTVFRDTTFVAQVVVDRVLGRGKAAVHIKMLGNKPQAKGEIRQGDRAKRID